MLDAEAIECAALRDLHDMASQEIRAALRLQTANVDGAFVSAAGALPATAIVINRTLGCGLSQPATTTTVRNVLSVYQCAGIERFFVQHHPKAAPALLTEFYLDQGLKKVRGWQKFSRGPEPVEQRQTELEIRRAEPEDAEAFARIVCDAEVRALY